MGNPILSDDAVGIRLAPRPAARASASSPGVDVVEECCVGGLNLLDLVAGYDRLIVLDSIKTTAGAPGAWYRFDAIVAARDHEPEQRPRRQLRHRPGARPRGWACSVPADAEIHIFAVEIADNVTFSEELSPALQAAYPELAEEIIAEIRALLGADEAPRERAV